MSLAVQRKGTFVLSEPGPANESGIDKQNVMRLRINRIALVQEMRVEHIIDHLTDAGVLNEPDQKQISNGSTPQDKARVLVDILTGKGKQVDWYRSFREALLHPDAGGDVKRRYRHLVEFLDNTVIHRPTSQSSRFSDVTDKRKLPHYQALPSIQSPIPGKTQNVLNLEEERKMREDETDKSTAIQTIPESDDKFSIWSGHFDTNDSMTMVKGYFQQWIPTPDNFRSLLQVPEEHFSKLQQSSDPVDKEQLNQESLVLERMRKLEIITVLARRKLLPVGFELCMCDVVQEILHEPQLYHLYFKYFKYLESVDVNLLQDVLNSFYSILRSNATSTRNTESLKLFTALAFNLINFLTYYGYVTDAEKVMSVLMAFLSDSHHIDIWMTKYKGFIKLMHLHNRNYNFVAANQAFQAATEMNWQIKLMSFGQDIVDEGELHCELSHMLLELGSINAAFSWSQSSLRSMHPENKAVVINTLCNTVMTYCAKWQVKRAEKLAIYTVQLARKEFGQRNPLYVKALLHYCHYSSEFKQDKDGLIVAEFALATAKKIYGCETIQVGLAHRAVSKALLVLQKFDTEKYYYHAYEALRIARSILPEEHPMLYIFLHTSASALQWKALHANKEMQDATLRQAETEARQALDLVTQHFGEMSLRTAQVYSLLGQIYSKMEQSQMAEDMMQTSVALMKLCQPPNSYFRLLASATLGTYYKIMQKPKESVMILRNVIENIASVGYYMKWIHMCFENLISTLQSLNLNKQADAAQIHLSHWLRDNPKYESEVSLATLNMDTINFDQFMEEFNIWEKSKNKILEHAKDEKEKENREKATEK